MHVLMIKSLIILVLLVVLIAGAFLSRPSPEGFKTYLHQKSASTTGGGGGAGGLLQGLLNDAQIDAYTKSLTFKDRLLWIDVQRDGQTVYTGAFAHWWERSGGATSASPTAKSPA